MNVLLVLSTIFYVIQALCNFKAWESIEVWGGPCRKGGPLENQLLLKGNPPKKN